MAHSYSHSYNLPTVGQRCLSVYGRWDRPDMALLKFNKLLLAGEPIQLFNCGKQRHDFNYIDAIIERVIRMLHQPAVVVKKGTKFFVAWYRNEFELI